MKAISFAAAAFIALGAASAPAGAQTLTYEAESLTVTHSGTGTSLQSDANTSGGQWISLNATGTGSWMEFTLPNVPAGTYSFRLKYKSNNNRGQMDLRVDGVQVGGILDQYSSTAAYPTFTFGNVTFASSGNHLVRMRVTGKNSSSSSYTLSADQFILVGQ
jgi:carbohydrate binding protein with CBM35 domain